MPQRVQQSRTRLPQLALGPRDWSQVSGNEVPKGFALRLWDPDVRV